MARTVCDYPGTVSDWKGFERHDFHLDGHAAIMVAPPETAPGRPWVWRALFFGAFPSLDLAILKEGFHVGYVDVNGLYGAPEARRRWDLFHRWATETLGLSPTPVLEGFSRGGLPVYNWGGDHPEKVCCIYADNPVCDFRSWPGGKGVGPGAPDEWEICLKAYGATEAEALALTDTPFHRLEALARAGVPVLHVCGDADETVPYEENTVVLAEKYRKLGGAIDVIVKPGAKHHPHSLEDPTPIARFILKAWRARGVPGKA